MSSKLQNKHLIRAAVENGDKDMLDSHQRSLKYVRIILIATLVLTILGMIHWKLQSLGAMIYGTIVTGYTYQTMFRGKHAVGFESLGMVAICVTLTVICTCLATLLICNILNCLLDWRNTYCSANLMGVVFNISWFSCLFVLIMTWLWYKKEKRHP